MSKRLRSILIAGLVLVAVALGSAWLVMSAPRQPAGLSEIQVAESIEGDEAIYWDDPGITIGYASLACLNEDPPVETWYDLEIRDGETAMLASMLPISLSTSAEIGVGLAAGPFTVSWGDTSQLPPGEYSKWLRLTSVVSGCQLIEAGSDCSATGYLEVTCFGVRPPAGTYQDDDHFWWMGTVEGDMLQTYLPLIFKEHIP